MIWTLHSCHSSTFLHYFLDEPPNFSLIHLITWTAILTIRVPLSTFNCLHFLLSHRKGYGTISAAGGRGWGGGGGGRISLDCYSIQEDVKVTVHGSFSSSFRSSKRLNFK